MKLTKIIQVMCSCDGDVCYDCMLTPPEEKRGEREVGGQREMTPAEAAKALEILEYAIGLQSDSIVLPNTVTPARQEELMKQLTTVRALIKKQFSAPLAAGSDLSRRAELVSGAAGNLMVAQLLLDEVIKQLESAEACGPTISRLRIIQEEFGLCVETFESEVVGGTLERDELLKAQVEAEKNQMRVLRRKFLELLADNVQVILSEELKFRPEAILRENAELDGMVATGGYLGIITEAELVELGGHLLKVDAFLKEEDTGLAEEHLKYFANKVDSLQREMKQR